MALLSLFVASERYPVVAEIGSAEIRAQDLLFLIVIVASTARLARWAARRPVLAASLGLFLMCLGISALRSPLGTAALIAVAKYGEFVVAGLAIGLALRTYRRPELVTSLLAWATTFVAGTAAVELVLEGGARALIEGRSGGALSMESATAAAAATAVWCSLRLTRLEGPAERAFAVLGIVGAGAVLVLAKSVLILGAGIAFAVLIPVLRSPWMWRAAVVCGLLLVIAAVGRTTDIKAAVGLDATAGSTRTALAAPPPGARPALPMPFTRHEPKRVTGGSFIHRIALAYLGVRIALDAPAFGHGWLTTSDGSFLRSGPYDLYMLERFPRFDPTLLVSAYPTSAHNAYIQTASEAGPLATVLLITVLVAAMVPAVALLRRQRAVMPWRVASGLGWLIVVSVFLASSALFGGQLETCLLGASLALCEVPARERLGPSTWLLSAAIVGAVVAAFLAVVMLPRGAGYTPAVARVSLMNAEGNEVFAPGTDAGEPSEAQLTNGLARAWVEGEQVMLRTSGATGGPASAEASVVHVSALSQVRKAVVGARVADAASVEFVDAHGRRIATLTMARGVPGVYVSLAGDAAMVARGSRGIALGSDLGYAKSPVTRLRERRIPAETPVLVTGRENARVMLPLHPVQVSASAGNLLIRGAPETTTFVGLHPHEQRVASLEPGTYAVRTGRGAGPMLIRRADPGSSPVWASRATMFVPFLLDNAQRSGVAESVSLGLIYRAPALG